MKKIMKKIITSITSITSVWILSCSAWAGCIAVPFAPHAKGGTIHYATVSFDECDWDGQNPNDDHTQSPSCQGADPDGAHPKTYKLPVSSIVQLPYWLCVHSFVDDNDPFSALQIPFTINGTSFDAAQHPGKWLVCKPHHNPSCFWSDPE